MDFQEMTKMLREHFQKPKKFLEAVKVFPNTWVEDLAGIHCAVFDTCGPGQKSVNTVLRLFGPGRFSPVNAI
jgi:hypothetical protein